MILYFGKINSNLQEDEKLNNLKDVFKEIENTVLNELNKENNSSLDSETLKISQDFHNKYYDEMYDKQVKVTLMNGTEIIGYFCDEFYEDNSILVDTQIIKIKDIKQHMKHQ